MVRKTTPVLLGAILALSLAVGLVVEVRAQGSSSYGANMVFRWGYPEDAPAVDTWNIRIQRRFGDDVTVEEVPGWTDQHYEVIEIPFGVRISISVQGVNASGLGGWSDWSEEYLREYPTPALPTGN